MKKIYFVGIHNKPGMFPLDSKSRSGKIIDRLIINFPDRQCIKSNVFNIDYMPTERKPELDIQWVENWIDRLQYKHGDIVVCLGQMVVNTFDLWRKTKCPASKRPHLVKAGHPSAVWSHEKQIDYIKTITERINDSLSQV
jgi:hypothetical protein